MASGPTILLVCDDPAETTAIEDAIGDAVAAERVQSLQELQHDLTDDFHWDLVVCAWSFQDGTWRDAMRRIQTHRPDLPVIIFGRAGIEHEWSEVRKSGAFDLLTAPYRDHTVRRVMEQDIALCQTWRLHSVAIAAKSGAGRSTIKNVAEYRPSLHVAGRLAPVRINDSYVHIPHPSTSIYRKYRLSNVRD
jgi:DNA-binding NtrC family response regulator